MDLLVHHISIRVPMETAFH